MRINGIVFKLSELQFYSNRKNFMFELLTIKQASKWASDYLKKDVSILNISYLVQYGRILKIDTNGIVYVSKNDFFEYQNICFMPLKNLFNLIQQ